VNVAEVIARRLAAAGCRHAFGIPGGETLVLLDALRRAGIRFVLAKHENAAGFMAEGLWQRSGAPPVLITTLGPGAANAALTVAHAEQDRVPLIVISACLDGDEALSYNHQIFDHRRLFEPIVKASFRVEPRAAGLLIDKALAIAADGRPGPVHLDLPVAVAGAEHGEDRGPHRVAPAATAPAPGPALEEARGWLGAAKRPLVLAGLDCVHHHAAEPLRAFAETFGAPVVTTYKAKGVMPEDHPLALGAGGLSPEADRILLPLFARADCVVLAGYDPIEVRRGWRDAFDPERQRVIEIAALPNHHYMQQASVSFVCHVGAALEVLGRDQPPRSGWPDGEPDGVRAALARAFGRGQPWGPAAVAEEVRAALPRDGVATVDSGAHRIVQSQVWRCHEPRTLLQSVGLGAMGTAIGLAIGAKLAEPERAVVAMLGDACLEMLPGDLATARDLGLAFPVVVYADASLALIELKQRGAQLANTGVDFGATDFAALGRALGGRGVWVEERAALAAALAEAFAAETFTVIACRLPRRAYDGLI